jgi:hypothetical protein
MKSDELLRNLRDVVREEMRLATDALANRMDARFDHVHSLFDGVNARLDRCVAEYQSSNEILTRIAP